MIAPRAPKPFAVVVTKASGTDVVVSMFTTQADADAASSRLRSFGLTPRVEEIRTPGVVPGSAFHRGETAAR